MNFHRETLLIWLHVPFWISVSLVFFIFPHHNWKVRFLSFWVSYLFNIANQLVYFQSNSQCICYHLKNSNAKYVWMFFIFACPVLIISFYREFLYAIYIHSKTEDWKIAFWFLEHFRIFLFSRCFHF